MNILYILSPPHHFLAAASVALLFLAELAVTEAYLEGQKDNAFFTAMPPGTCQGDNWGLPHQTNKPVARPNYYEQLICILCLGKFEDKERATAMFELFPNATVIHSKMQHQ
jgi:hypothetical protein